MLSVYCMLKIIEGFAPLIFCPNRSTGSAEVLMGYVQACMRLCVSAAGVFFLSWCPNFASIGKHSAILKLSFITVQNSSIDSFFAATPPPTVPHPLRFKIDCSTVTVMKSILSLQNTFKRVILLNIRINLSSAMRFFFFFLA